MVVRFFAYIRDYTHAKEVKLDECADVRELLQKLCGMYGSNFENKVFKNGELSREIIILINGRHIAHYEGLETKLNKEDEISIFPVVAGG